MTRRWFVSTSAFILGTSLSTIAWSQTTPSFAERIEDLRGSWTDGATPDTTTPAPSANPSASSGTSGTVPTTPRKSPKAGPVLPPSSRNTDTGIPQVDAGSLIPKGLFSRPGTENSLERGPNQKTPTAGNQTTASGPAAKSPQSPRAVAQSRAGTARPSATAASEFSLPGLGNPTTSTSRAGSNTAPQAVVEKPSSRTDVASKTPVASRRKSTSDSGRTAATAEPVARRSPEMRTPVHFDPDSVRDDLAGSFGNTPSTTKSESIGSSASDDEHSPASAEGPSFNVQKRPLIARPTQKDDADTEATTSDSNYSADPGFSTKSQKSQLSNRDTDRDSGTTNDQPEPTSAFHKSVESEPTAMAIRPSRQPSSYRDTPPAASSADARNTFTDGDSHAAAPSSVIVTNQAPVITSDIRGPKQIVIGRPASYTLRLQNKSSVAADDMVVSLKIPSWAEVVSSSPSHGSVTQADTDANSGTLQWQISQLAAQGTESLNLELIPRASRPLELGCTWSFSPVGSKAIVEVQEPKLRMQIAGPDDVLFGKPNVYRLTLSNPGTGLAENVSIAVVPPGGDEHEAAISHVIGNLAPGANKTVEIEMTARDAGKLRVQAMASAEGDLHAETTKDVFCRKPELEVDWRGPAMQYAGTPATYFFRVRNPGTAAADDVAVHAVLPAGAEFVSASDGNAIDSSKREVKWRVGSLGPGDDCYMELRCVVRTPGDNQIKVTAATSAGDLSDVKTGSTNVVALADLKLDVTDPPGPVPVGEEAIYEVRIENRGTSAAEEVNVVGLFSEGLEPEAVDGGSYNVSDGRVSFRPIHKIPAGQKVQLQIHARALKTGTHVFRAEVLCRDQEIKLAAEQTTRFYDSQVSHDGAPTAPATARRPDRIR